MLKDPPAVGQRELKGKVEGKVIRWKKLCLETPTGLPTGRINYSLNVKRSSNLRGMHRSYL